MEEDDNDIKERCRKEDRRAQVKKEWGMSEEKKCPNLNLDASAEMYSISGIDARFHLGILGRGSLLERGPYYFYGCLYSNNCSE